MTERIANRAWRIAADHRRLQQAARDKRLQPAEWSVLAFLAGGTAATSDELRRRLALERGSLTNALSELRARGLIQTTGSPKDARQKVHALTTAGKEVTDVLITAFEAKLRKQ